MTDQPACTPENPGRRRLCQWAIGGMTTVAVGTVGFPVLTFLTLPRSNRGQSVMKIPLASVKEGTAVWGEHQGRQIVIIKTDGRVLAFDGACTHLGCIIQWDAASRTFKCPCHGASFDATGNPASGPVNEPLRPVTVTVDGDVLTIS